MIVFDVIGRSPAGFLNKCMLRNPTNRLRWPTGWKLTSTSSISYADISEAPDPAHLRVSGDFPLSSAALNIKTATVPCTMAMALLPMLRLSARTVRQAPLR